MIDLGQVCYESFTIELTRRLGPSVKFPAWDELPGDYQESWRVAAQSVANSVGGYE